MQPGNLVQCRDGVLAIICEIRGNIAVLMREGSAPSLEYMPVADLRIAPGAQNAILRQYYEYYAEATQFRIRAQGSDTLQKGAPPGTIAKRVTVHGPGRTYTAVRYVKVEAPKVHTTRKETSEEKSWKDSSQRVTQEWREKLTPSEEQYEGIINGDRQALGDYLMSALWKRAAGEVETATQVSLTHVVNDLAKRITGIRPEGFEPADIMQEVAIRFMEMQDNGRFANNQVPREKFAGFMAQTVRNTSLEILRKQRLDKYAEEDISQWADRIADVRQADVAAAAEAEATDAKALEALHVIRDTYVNMPPQQRMVVAKIMEGKSHEQISQEMGTSVDSVKSRAKRAYNTLRRELYNKGYSLHASDKGMTRILKQVLRREIGTTPVAPPATTAKARMVAQIVLRDGRLILKARKYEVGDISPVTGKKKVAPGKWEDVAKGKKGAPSGTGSKKKKKGAPTGGGGEGATVTKKKALIKLKDSLKSTFKDIASVLADVYKGHGGTEATAQAIGHAGAHIENVGNQMKQVKVPQSGGSGGSGGANTPRSNIPGTKIPQSVKKHSRDI